MTVTPATVTITDNDSPGVTVNTASLTVFENLTSTYTLRLNTQPSAQVTVTPTSSATANATVSGAVTFTTGNWATPQSVTVAGVAEGASTVSHAVTSSDSNYPSSLSVASVAVTVSAISTLYQITGSATVAEGNTTELQVTVGQPAPAGGLTLDVDYDFTGGSAERIDLQRPPRMVTVQEGETTATLTLAARAEETVEGDETFTVTISASAADTAAGWVAVTNADTATVTITDADTAEASIWFGGSPDTLYRVDAPRNIGVDVKLSVSRRAKTAFSVDTIVVTGEGTASEGTHFEIPNKTVTFNPTGVSQGSLRVNIINIADSEGKTIVLSIINPSANTDLSQHYTLTPANPKATITITAPAAVTPRGGPGGPINPGGPGPGTPVNPDPDNDDTDTDTDPGPDETDPDPDDTGPDDTGPGTGPDDGDTDDSGDTDPDGDDGDTGDGAEQPAGFSDVDPNNTHVAAIAAIHAANITTGCGTNPLRYCPDQPVTRAQMASFLVRALNLPAADTAGFNDVDLTNTHTADINALAAAGITRGCSAAGEPLRYCPDQPVTRAQMASFLVRALNLPAADTAGFNDVDLTNTHSTDIDALFAAGITRGCSAAGEPLRYCPDQPVTRAQMASFLTRALNLPTPQTA